MREAWSEALVTSFREVMNRLSHIAPRVLAMLTLILLGWAVAGVVSRLAVRLSRVVDLDARCARWGLTSGLARSGLAQLPSLAIGRLIFWTIFCVALLMGIEALEMPATAGLVAGVIRFLPNLVIATLVWTAGWLLANFMAQAVLIAAVNAQIAFAPLIAGAMRWLVLIFAGAAVLTQLGIAREMVLLTFGIAFGGTVLALALAFGLGGKELAREILESRLHKEAQNDDHVTHI
jgi:hypothetical protein